MLKIAGISGIIIEIFNVSFAGGAVTGIVVVVVVEVEVVVVVVVEVVILGGEGGDVVVVIEGSTVIGREILLNHFPVP
jgi:hypothetical protein